ncbi:MAG: cytochrome c maturation protein CcmE [Cystobacterineae bacterium]|nr:cytochrome c maturation protein CcmE [Cystobacterineae bacterium]
MSPQLKNKLLAAGALAIAAGALIFVTQSSIGQNLIYYWTPSEMLAKGSVAIGPTIRLGGVVEGGSIQWNEAQGTLSFRVCDSEATPEKTCVPVHSTEVPPQMFREHIGVVIEGNLGKNAVFSSKRLMVNHSNEYQAPHDGQPPADWKNSVSETAP